MVAFTHPTEAEKSLVIDSIAVLPVRNLIVYPHMAVPLVANRPGSVKALDEALQGDKRVLVLAQRDPGIDRPGPSDLYNIGTLSVVHKAMRLPEDSLHVLVQGVSRARVLEVLETEPVLRVRVELLPDEAEDSVEVEALTHNLSEQFQKLVALVPTMSDELKIPAINLERQPSKLADFVAFNLKMSLEDQQAVLELTNVHDRLKGLTILLNREVEVAETGSRIQSQVQNELGKAQREYYLREQMKAIQKELGEADERTEEQEDLTKKIVEAGMPEEVRAEAERELKRLERIPPSSPEYTIARTYLEWLTDLPWATSTKDRLDIAEAKDILDEDHYGLEKIKDRILEHLAVRKLRPEMKGPILCFVGPPGVGKTSLGKSIARALGRKFVRMSLGGVHDEAEIRGHRRTYIGALPGRIIQGIRKAGSNNPVFILDEIDKVGMDFRGDPAAALLEVLDPEQNDTFSDHYLDVPFDLSNVMFITTANVLSTIPGPLRDRMEVIEIAGYTEEEKIEIARRHLIPKQLAENGIGPEQLTFDDETLSAVISGYTREAGLRNLEREIGALCRKIARRIAEGRIEPFVLGPDDLRSYLGPQKFHAEAAERTGEPGVAIGLAWTPTGGEIMFVEASRMSGKKGLTLTGQLGDVMKESAQAALTYVRSHAASYGIDPDFFEQSDIHIHLPAGAIPKDGPSAGVTLVTVLTSLLTGRPVRNDLAMTGEVTLRGKILPVGGIKEKVLGAQRAGITTIVLPKRNEKDLDDVPESIKAHLSFCLVDRIDQVLELSLMDKPENPPKPGWNGAIAERMTHLVDGVEIN
ncbi:MAG: endopeptidase La [candidate division Zixibacteria bacterium]|nr:endopeptidase La [candidate division Zixibacteria bacterium]